MGVGNGSRQVFVIAGTSSAIPPDVLFHYPINSPDISLGRNWVLVDLRALHLVTNLKK